MAFEEDLEVVENSKDDTNKIPVEIGGKIVRQPEPTPAKFGGFRRLIGIGATALMLKADANEAESEDKYAGLRFEAGLHPLGDGTKEVMNNLFQSGDPNTHYWKSDGLVERLKQRNVRILTIDGLGARTVTNENSGEVVYLSEANWTIWAGLPDRPRNINDRGEVYVVSGDNMFVENSFERGFLNNDARKAEFAAELEEDSRSTTEDNVEKNRFEPRVAFGLGVLASAIGLYSTFKRNSEDVVSRREFLGLLGRRLALPFLLGGLKSEIAIRIAVNGAAKAQDIEEADIYLNLARIAGPDFVYDEWVRARTASMILKSKDGIDILQSDPNSGISSNDTSAVVAGNAHSIEAKGFLESEKDSNKAVLDYAQKLVDAMDKVLKKASDIKVSRGEIIEHVKSHLAQTFIYKVTDPGIDAPDPKFVDKLQDFIDVTHDFKSPRILAALKGLK